MEEEIILELQRRIENLKVFVTNVGIGGIGIMSDNETRNQFEAIYIDIDRYLQDKMLSIYAPPLPHLGITSDNQTLTPKHQALIVHHGTMLLQYVTGIIKANSPLPTDISSNYQYINQSRLDELKQLKHTQYDLSKLIRLCEEINICYSSRCYFSVISLVRTMLNHIPPVFQFRTFKELAANYLGGGKSFKESMERLEYSSRKIADGTIHIPVREKEILPNETQVNYSNDIDLLLSEVIRVLSV